MTPEQRERADYIKSILPERFTVKDVVRLGLYPEVTLRSMISRGIGPQVFRIGSRVIIPRDSFIDWLNVKDEERLKRNAIKREGIIRAKQRAKMKNAAVLEHGGI